MTMPPLSIAAPHPTASEGMAVEESTAGETSKIALPEVQILQGPMGSGKTTRLVQSTVAHLTNPQARDGDLLILCANHHRKAQFQASVMQALGQQHQALGDIHLYTYAGWVRTCLFNYWPLIEADLTAQSGTPTCLPDLVGLSASETILRVLFHQQLIDHPEAFQGFRGGRHHILNEILRRLRARGENALSAQQLRARSSWAGLPFLEETTQLEKNYERASLALRMLDGAKQLDAFVRLCEHEQARAAASHQGCFGIGALVVDDLDEASPAQLTFVRTLAPSCQQVHLAWDPKGGSRRGYLNADPVGAAELIEALSSAPNTNKQVITCARQDAVTQTAHQWLTKLLPADAEPPDDSPESQSEPQNEPQTSPSAPIWQVHPPADSVVTLADQVVQQVLQWIRAGATPSDITLVFPHRDGILHVLLSQAFRRLGIPTQSLSGTQTVMDNPICRAWLTLLLIQHRHHWRIHLTETSLTTVLVAAFKWHVFDHAALLRVVPWLFTQLTQPAAPETTVPAPVLPSVDALDAFCASQHPAITLSTAARERYTAWVSWSEASLGKPLAEQALSAFHTCLVPYFMPGEWHADTTNTLQTLTQLYQQLVLDEQLLQRFQALPSTDPHLGKAISQLQETPTDALSTLVMQQLCEGQAADTPALPDAQASGVLLMGTPQKVIDLGCPRRWVAWLDVSHGEWNRSDDAPLYDAPLFSPTFARRMPAAEDLPPELLPQDYWQQTVKPQLRAERLAHQCRTLLLMATQGVAVFETLTDPMGLPHLGGIRPLLDKCPDFQRALTLAGEAPSLSNGKGDAAAGILLPVLRPDQLPVWQYQHGTMAISAVPGAGKTFVNVALILKLIADGVPAEQILVLTFMDSAAKDFQKRLAEKLPPHHPLPTMTTIHGLALRLITETDVLEQLGLDRDQLTILDDFQKRDMVLAVTPAEVFADNNTTTDSWYSVFDRTLEWVRQQRIPLSVLEERIPELHIRGLAIQFVATAKAYAATKRQNNAMDFTDLIVMAIEALEASPALRESVQKRYRVVIEDEAQDSSALLQVLIGLLGGPQPNLIRTGDVNQSITTSFSAADPDVFRQFARTAQHQVVMSGSARSCTEVITLANTWLARCSAPTTALKTVAQPERLTFLTQAFSPVAMQPVAQPGLAHDTPVTLNPPRLCPELPITASLSATAYPSWDDELSALVEHCHRLRATSPQATMAVLVSTNDQVIQVANRLEREGIPAIGLSDKTNTSPMMVFVQATLHWLAFPTLLAAQRQWCRAAQQLGWTVWDDALLAWLDTDVLLTASPEALPHPQLRQWYYDMVALGQQALSLSLPALVMHLVSVFSGYATSEPSPDQKSSGFLQQGVLCAMIIREALQQHHAQHQSHQLIPASDTTATSMAAVSLGIRRDGDLLWAATQLQQVLQQHKSRALADVVQQHAQQVVQVMTLHKSKGQEFDVVWMPAMVETPWRGKDERLIHQLKPLFGQALNKEDAKRQSQELFIQERARLIYVGITRAKRALYCSTHAQAPRFGKATPIAQKPSLAYTELADIIAELTTSAGLSPALQEELP